MATQNSNRTFRIGITGITPLLLDAMSNDVVVNTLIRRQRTPPQTDLSLETMAGAKLYRDPADSERLGIPVEMVFACLRDAGRYVKLDGNKKVSTGKDTQLPAIMDFGASMFFPFTEGTSNWVPDARKGTMASAGGKGVAVGIVRPKFQNWGIEFTVVIDFTVSGVSEGTIRSIVTEAGRRCGLGSFRPSCKGNFGKFSMTTFEEVSA